MDESIKELIIKIAYSLCDPNMSGPDGNAFCFCQYGYPEAIGFCADTEFEAALGFLKEIYQLTNERK